MVPMLAMGLMGALATTPPRFKYCTILRSFQVGCISTPNNRATIEDHELEKLFLSLHK
jgi:hypothetical protein